MNFNHNLLFVANCWDAEGGRLPVEKIMPIKIILAFADLSIFFISKKFCYRADLVSVQRSDAEKERTRNKKFSFKLGTLVLSSQKERARIGSIALN